ncbi:NADP-dependent succinic semialdehyde dehydrogenase [Microbacterium kribbense]|uniref:NADP-dependent succinic semialdehyde dehydrogenase n=1 Tax=Microbacterium kribbense TaxID=433645 RepID=A0ABP7G8E6_9MICO
MIRSINPTTGQVDFEIAAHTPAEVEERLQRASEAAAWLRTLTFAERARLMNTSADVLASDREDAARMMTTEMGKPITAARAEVDKCVKTMRFYAAHAERFLADSPVDDPATVGATHAATRWQPLGVVLAVMPWNYPLWQVIRFAAPALMAGNAGVLKHASNVPRSALYLDTLFERGGFRKGAFSTLLIGSADVAAVIEDPRIAAVTLTGSEPAGRSVASIAAAHVKKSVLELGGSDPFVVLASADIDKAVPTAVLARTLNNGQSCIAGKRFIVHDAVYDEFADKFTRAIAALKIGDPLEESTELGPLSTERGRDELAELVDDAVQKGAQVLTGAERIDRPGWYYPGTVLAGITPEMRVYGEEAFGPVATLYRAVDNDDALRIANGTEFGLSSAVWTEDPAEQERFATELQAGAVFVNGMSASYPELPFGGVKHSGFGRELSASGIREFCSLKTVWQR